MCIQEIKNMTDKEFVLRSLINLIKLRKQAYDEGIKDAESDNDEAIDTLTTLTQVGKLTFSEKDKIYDAAYRIGYYDAMGAIVDELMEIIQNA